MGAGTGTARYWTLGFSIACSQESRLLCFETGESSSLPDFATTGKNAFVTSITVTGNLGDSADAGGATGIAAGDTICQARAEAAGLPNSANFKAWLSDGTIDAKDRFTSDGPWVRIDGVKLAENVTDLSDGGLFTSINVDETGNYMPANYAWTGTDNTGLKTTETCSDWTEATSTVNGDIGRVVAAGSGWSDDFSPTPCNSSYRLYCFED
jgi:hypothetical protein